MKQRGLKRFRSKHLIPSSNKESDFISGRVLLSITALPALYVSIMWLKPGSRPTAPKIAQTVCGSACILLKHIKHLFIILQPLVLAGFDLLLATFNEMLLWIFIAGVHLKEKCVLGKLQLRF